MNVDVSPNETRIGCRTLVIPSVSEESGGMGGARIQPQAVAVPIARHPPAQIPR